jgi:hypothetical protein
MLTISSHLTGEPPALLQLRCHQDDDAKGDATIANSWGRLRVMYVGKDATNHRLYEYDDRGRVVTDTVKIDGDVYETQ